MSSKQETDRWIDDVYHVTDRQTLEQLYDSWAQSYDADLQQVGYLHLPVIAGLVSRHVLDRDGAILDAGVGTGAHSRGFELQDHSLALYAACTKKNCEFKTK